MLTATLLVHEDGHLRLTFLTDALPPVLARIVHVVADLVVLCFLALLVVASLMLMPSVRQQNTVTLGVSMVWFYAALPIGGALMFVLTVRSTVRRLAASSDPGSPGGRPCPSPSPSSSPALTIGAPIAFALGFAGAAAPPALRPGEPQRPADDHVRGHGFLPAARHPVLHPGRRPDGALRACSTG